MIGRPTFVLGAEEGVHVKPSPARARQDFFQRAALQPCTMHACEARPPSSAVDASSAHTIQQINTPPRPPPPCTQYCTYNLLRRVLWSPISPVRANGGYVIYRTHLHGVG